MQDERDSTGRRSLVPKWVQQKSKDEILTSLALIRVKLQELGPMDYDSLRDDEQASINFAWVALMAEECSIHFGCVDHCEDLQ